MIKYLIYIYYLDRIYKWKNMKMRVKCPRGGGLSVWALCLLDWKVVNTTDTPVTSYISFTRHQNPSKE